MVAVMRFDLGVGVSNQDYTGYDLVVFANVSNIAVSNPKISFGGATLQALKIDGVGSSTTLTSLGAGQVWATLVPEGTSTVSASIDGSAVTNLSNATITDNGVQYITSNKPTLNTATFDGFDAIAAQPNGTHLFGVS